MAILKKVNNSDAGDADHFGGNDLDNVSDYFNNTAATGAPVRINTQTQYRSGKLELRNPADTFSYVIKGDAITANRDLTLPLLTANDTLATINTTAPHSNYSYTIFIDNNTIKARNNVTGAIDYSGDATTDCAPTITNAINNLTNVGTNQDDDFTGSIFLAAGYYKCVTTITVDLDDVGANGVVLEGEGWGTFLDFVPSGALSRGILLKMAAPGLKNMRIKGNSNVTALIEVNGRINFSPRSNSNLFERLLIEGPNANGDLRELGDSFAPISGQIGIWFNAFVGGVDQFMFVSVIDKCKFISLDKAILGTGVDATSIFISNFYGYKNTTFLETTNTSGDHTLVNGYIEGSTYSRYGVHVVSSSANILISNVFGELGVTGQECALVKIDSGNNAAGLFLTSADNFLEGDEATWYTVLDVDNSHLGMYPGNYAVNNVPYWHVDNNDEIMYHVRKNIWQVASDQPVQIMRDTSTANNTVGLRFGFKDSNGDYQPYSFIFTRLITNTAGAVDGELSLWVKKANSSNEVLKVTKDGVLECGSLNRRVLLADTSLTAQRTFTFPDATTKLVGSDSSSVTFADGKNFALGSTSGTKIGTATTQKLGFFNATPIAQKAANADTSGATLSALETEVNELKQILRDYGLLAP